MKGSRREESGGFVLSLRVDCPFVASTDTHLVRLVEVVPRSERHLGFSCLWRSKNRARASKNRARGTTPCLTTQRSGQCSRASF